MMISKTEFRERQIKWAKENLLRAMIDKVQITDFHVETLIKLMRLPYVEQLTRLMTKGPEYDEDYLIIKKGYRNETDRVNAYNYIIGFLEDYEAELKSFDRFIDNNYINDVIDSELKKEIILSNLIGKDESNYKDMFEFVYGVYNDTAKKAVKEAVEFYESDESYESSYDADSIVYKAFVDYEKETYGFSINPEKLIKIYFKSMKDVHYGVEDIFPLEYMIKSSFSYYDKKLLDKVIKEYKNENNIGGTLSIEEVDDEWIIIMKLPAEFLIDRGDLLTSTVSMILENYIVRVIYKRKEKAKNEKIDKVIKDKLYLITNDPVDITELIEKIFGTEVPEEFLKIVSKIDNVKIENKRIMYKRKLSENDAKIIKMIIRVFEGFAEL